MRLSTIRYIITVAETGNFTRAAARLFVSQPALSQSIQRFEQEIGMPVFIRRKNELVLTDAGKAVVTEGEKMLEIERGLYSRLNSMRTGSPNTVSIGSASSYQRYFLTDALTQLQQSLPELRINVHEGFSHVLCAQVEERLLDYALAFEPFPKDLLVYPILREEIYLAVPPGARILEALGEYREEDCPYPLADLSLCREEAFIQYPEDRRIQQVLHQETQRAGFTPKTSVTSYSTEAANTMVFHGMGLALVPEVTVRLCPPEARPRYFRIRPGGYVRTLALICRKDPALSRVTEVLVERLLNRL